MLNDGIIFKITTDDKTYISFHAVFEDESTSTIIKKKQRLTNTTLYAVLFRRKRLVKTVSLKEQRTVTARRYSLSKHFGDLKINGLMLHYDDVFSCNNESS